MNDERRPLRTAVRAGEKLLNFAVFCLILILVLYSAYSIWYTRSLTKGSFLSEELAMYKPTGKDPTLEDLAAQNPDVRGWITINDTHIDYPLVQGEDDAKYLNRDVLGEFSLAGAIFLSSQNAPDFSDSYNIIYGHHIDGGAMFSDVLEFRDATFFEEHTSGILWTKTDAAFRISIFSCMEVNALDEMIYQDPHGVAPEDLPALFEDIMSRSIQKRSISIDESDHIIALSTCEDAESFDRVVLFGKITPMTKEEVEAAKAENLTAEQQASSEPSAAERKWYSPLIDHPWVLIAGGVLVLFLILLLIARLRRDRR